MRDMMRFSKVLLATTALVAVGSLALRAQAQTLPSGGSVASGQVAIGAPNAGRMAITQGSQNAIVNWQGFSIGQGGRVDITQPNSSAAMLNRVTGQAPSTIAGQLNANGRVYLVNPNGIAITQSGVVNTGSFVASTLGISDSDFLSGRLRFQGNGASAAVSNAGRIQAGPGGYAALLGGTVDNSGTISVPLGRIGLGSGERVTLDLSGDGFLQVAVPTAAGGDQALVSNSGRLSAPGGRVEIAAATAQSAARHAINMSGVVEAQSVSGRAGAISFSGGPGGTVNVSGRVDASSATGRGGNVTVTGARVALRGAEVNASGATGGGRVRIGGDRLGQGDLPRAQRVSVDNASVIRADATRRGDGGDIVLWSEGRTDFAGSISARGGAEGGRGGEAEVSSRGVLNYTGWTDLRAPLGAWGTLLLDPYNITISNDTQTNPGFTATTDDSVINAGTLVTALGGANVVVSTGTGGTQDGNITLAVSLTWSSASNLTLQAAGAIALNGAVTATAGGLTLQAGDTIGATGAISVARFELISGNWVQNATTLPGFAATDFRITGGSFLRAAGGAGTGLDPYRLTDIYGVQGMGSSSALRAASFQLANDIAAAGTSGWNGGAGFVPVGTDAARFTGSLNGAGYVINGLTINRPTTDFVGLIGASGSGSGISNLGLVGGSVTGGYTVGGLVGYNDGGSITQSYATGAVTGVDGVGGLVGYNLGTITQAYATGAVVGSGNYIGGLVGFNTSSGTSTGSITQSYATGAVTGGNHVGGLVAYNEGTITQSYATGSVTGSGSDVGGLVGANSSSGTITQSYWDTQTTGQTTSAGSSVASGLNTTAARTQASYVGWDFGNSGVWYQAGDMRPILRSEAATAVDGVISIRNLNQLQLMNINLAGSYRLAGNIAASASSGSNAAGIWGSGGFVPVGTDAARFTGRLDGAGYVISGLTINRQTTNYVGLIGYAGSGSSISNLGLVGGSVTGSNNVGGLVGYNLGGSITQSYATGAVTGSNNVGGLAGYNGGLPGSNVGTITQSYATGAVTGSIFVGGLVGNNSGGSITQAYATGAVTGSRMVGGLVGVNVSGASITQSYATGAVTGSGNYVGGLVGYNDGTITQAYATGAVEGNDFVGGLVGRNDSGTITQAYATGTVSGSNQVGGLVGEITGGAITQSYATGVVTGSSDYVGGLVGYNRGSITQSYATGAVTGRDYVGGLVGTNSLGSNTQSYATGAVTGRDYVGGLVGMNSDGSITRSYATGAVTGSDIFVGGLVGRNVGAGSIMQSYWDTDTTGQTTSAGGGTGLTTAEARSQASYSGWDFGSVWYQAGDMRPMLRFEAAAPVGGVITIRNLNQLQLMNINLAGSYRLAGNIDASATNATESSPGIWGSGGFVPVGTDEAPFTGSLNGAGRVINGLNIDRPTTDYVGLIGFAGSGSSISNLGLVGGSVTGRVGVGGLVGYNDGSSITQAYATGVVTGSGLYIGGLVGANLGSITQSYATGAVTGAPLTSGYVGGLVGANDGTITQSYATGAVTGRDVVGGLVGVNTSSGSITQSYAIGRVEGSRNYVGGLVGSNDGGSITQSYATTGAVNGVSYVGGLVGYNAGGTIAQSYATGRVTGSGNVVGGLVGSHLSGGSITESYATGAVTGGDLVGGLVGYNAGSITQSYATTGAVNGGNYVGGLVGTNEGGITQSYATGAVTGIAPFSGNFVGGLVGENRPGATIGQSYATGAVAGSGDYIGGLVGFNDDNGTITQSYATGSVDGSRDVGGLVGRNFGSGSITQSYWDTQTTGRDTSDGGTGRTTAEMQDITSFSTNYADWNFTNIWSPPNQVGQNNGSATAYYPQLYSLSPAVAVSTSLSFSRREYGDSNPIVAGTSYAGLRPGDSITTGGTLTGLPGLTANVGTYQVSVSGTVVNAPSGAVYRMIYVPVALSVTPRLITVTPDSGQSREYGDANPELNYALTRSIVANRTLSDALPRTKNGSDGVLVGTDSLTGALASVATGTSGIGDYAINQGTLAASSNYTLSFTTGVNMAVRPRLITVTPDSGLGRQYGDANPTLTYTVARADVGAEGLGNKLGAASPGLVNGDTLTGALATSAIDTSIVGNYAINQGDLAGSNYTIFFTSDRTMAVTPRLITVTPDSGQRREYGDANPVLSYALTRTVANRTLSDALPSTKNGSDGVLVGTDSLTGALASVATGTSGIGNYAINQGTLAASSNYTLSFTTGVNMAVTPRRITVTPNAGQSREYGDANPTLSYALTRTALVDIDKQMLSQPLPRTMAAASTDVLVGSDRLTGALASVATGTSGIGDYAINQGNLAASNNYTLSFTTGVNMAVRPRLITVTPDSGLGRQYGDANPTLTYTTVRTGGSAPGLVTGDSLNGALASVATSTDGIGNYAINQGNLANSNYTISFTSGRTMAVTPRLITVTADSGQSREYGDANPTLTYALSRTTSGAAGTALVNGNTLTGALASVATGTSNVDNYAINQGDLAASSNYTLSFTTGVNMAVTPRRITVTPNSGQSREYGDTNPVLSYSVARDVRPLAEPLSGDKNFGASPALVNGDTLTGALASVATGTSVVADYAINQGNLAASSNYTITFTTGRTMGVTPRLITVTPNAGQSREYGDSNPTLTYALTRTTPGATGDALVNGNTLSGALASVANATSIVDNYAIAQGSIVAPSSNYTLSFTTGVNMAVTPRVITVTADNVARDYGMANPALTYRITSSSLVGGDTFTGSLVTNAGSLSEAGSYAISQGSLALSANYALTLVPGTLTVRPTAMVSNGGSAYVIVEAMNLDGQMFSMSGSNPSKQPSLTERSFGTSEFIELILGGGLNVQRQ
jgi:filamentous hemagglutinin family protein